MVNAGAIWLECLSARDFCVDGFFEQHLSRDGQFLDCTCIDRHDSAGQRVRYGNGIRRSDGGSREHNDC